MLEHAMATLPAQGPSMLHCRVPPVQTQLAMNGAPVLLEHMFRIRQMPLRTGTADPAWVALPFLPQQTQQVAVPVQHAVSRIMPARFAPQATTPFAPPVLPIHLPPHHTLLALRRRVLVVRRRTALEPVRHVLQAIGPLVLFVLHTLPAQKSRLGSPEKWLLAQI